MTDTYSRVRDAAAKILNDKTASKEVKCVAASALTQLSVADRRVKIVSDQARLDKVADRLGELYQQVGNLEPRLGGDGRKCIKIMDQILALALEVEDISGRKARG